MIWVRGESAVSTDVAAGAHAASGERELIREAIRDLVSNEASRERVDEWDEASHYPVEFFRKLAELGYSGMTFGSAGGAEGTGVVEAMVVVEELARRGLDLSAGYSLTEFLGMNIRRHGSPAQQQRYLPASAAGDVRFSIAMTEPDAGSDAAGIRLSATSDGADRYVLNGQKTFITGGGLPNTLMHVTAVTDAGAGRRKGMTVFLVPNDTPGVRVSRLKTIGRHLLGTWEVFFDDVVVEAEQALGGIDNGWEVLESGLAAERLFGCASYVGAHGEVLDLMSEYVNDRRQFGRSIGSFQAVSHPIANVYSDYEASRALRYRTAGLVESGRATLRDVSVAKLFCSEAFQRATNVGMQLMGGYGYMYEYSMQRYWREARIATVVAGTSEIQRTIISRGLGIGGRRDPAPL
jgi:alkylation response protein AidB-like acyl-CoA dehydrogenase